MEPASSPHSTPTTTITDLDDGACAVVCLHLAAFDAVALASLACTCRPLASAVLAGADDAWRLALQRDFRGHAFPPRSPPSAAPPPSCRDRRSPCAERYAFLASAAAASRRRAAALRAHRAASVMAALERAAADARAALAAVPPARAALARDAARARAAAAAGDAGYTPWVPRAIARGLEFVRVLDPAPPFVEQAALACRSAELDLHAAVETRRLAAVQGRLTLARADLAAATVAARTLAERRSAACAFRSERRKEEEGDGSGFGCEPAVGAAAVDAAERRWAVGWGWPREEEG